MAVKKGVLFIIFVFFVFSLSVSASSGSFVSAFSAPQSYYFESADEYCLLSLPFEGGSSDCGVDMSLCSGFQEFKDAVNGVRKIEHSVLLVPFSVESLDGGSLFSFYDDYFVLNDFRLTLGIFSWESDHPNTLSAYQALFNNNQISYGCSDGVCSADIKMYVDCNFYLNRTVWQFWYWFKFRDGPEDILKRLVYLALKPVFFSFVDDGVVSKTLKLYPVEGSRESIDFMLSAPGFVSSAFSGSEYGLRSGYFEGSVGMAGVVRPLYILVVGDSLAPASEPVQDVLSDVPSPVPVEESPSEAPSSRSSSSSSGGGGSGSSSGSSSSGGGKSSSSGGGGGGGGGSSSSSTSKSVSSGISSGKSSRPKDSLSSSGSGVSSESASGSDSKVLKSSRSAVFDKPVKFNFENKFNFALVFSILIVGFYLAKEYLPLDDLPYKVRKKLFK